MQLGPAEQAVQYNVTDTVCVCHHDLRFQIPEPKTVISGMWLVCVV